MVDFQSRRARQFAAIVLVLAVLPTLWFGLRTYRSYLLFQSAYAQGAPKLSSLRGWMTLRYVAANYGVPADSLVARLNLALPVSLDASLKSLAEQHGLSPFEYVKRVQRAVAESAVREDVAVVRTEPWFGIDTDAVLSALLVYGYPMLGLILFLGALGVPVPTGLATALAGALARGGQLDWFSASAIAVAASVTGDIVGFAIGLWLGKEFLKRRGRWFGFTPSRQAGVQALFDRWGAITVLLTRTLVSHLSSVVSLLAGLSRYSFGGFIAFAIIGRVIWTAAYLGLGFSVGNDIESASDFLANLTGFLISLALFVIAGMIAVRRKGDRHGNQES